MCFFLNVTGKSGKIIHSVYLLQSLVSFLSLNKALVGSTSFSWTTSPPSPNSSIKSANLRLTYLGMSWNFCRLFPWTRIAAGNFYLSLLYSIFVTSLCLKFLHCQLILVLHLVQRLSILLTCTHFVDDCNYLNYLTRPSACCRVAPACLQPDQPVLPSPRED